MKRFLLLLTVVSCLLLLATGTVAAQEGITVSDTSLKVDFPQQMVFNLAANSPADITNVGLAVRFPQTTTRLKPNFTPGKQINATANWELNNGTISSVGGHLPPGASGEYSWHLEDAAGNKLDTPFQPFRLDDNRHQWQKLENDKVALFWYDGDQSFGQQIFDKANLTLNSIQNDIGATLEQKSQIFIYGDRPDFLDALGPGNHEWAGGTIDDTFGIVLIDADAESLDYALSTTPHELTHLVIAQDLKGPYKDVSIPLWMNEGLAVYHEYTPPQNEPRFAQALQKGIRSNTLHRLRALSSSFPNDASVVELAYGEAYSVVAFMLDHYGPAKVSQLMTLFKGGTTADDAFMQVLGVDQDGLENLWRQSVGAPTKDYAKLPTATPGAVPTFALSSAVTPGAETATPPPTQISAVETAAPQSEPTAVPSSQGGSGGGNGGLCGGVFGGIALASVGAWQLRKRRFSHRSK